MRGWKVATYLGSLAQLCFGEGGTLQTNPTGMCLTVLTADEPHKGCHSRVSCPSQVQATQSPGCATKAQSQVDHASPQGSLSQAVTLLADMNCAGSQEDVDSDWVPTHSLVGGMVSGAKISVAPCLLPPTVMHLPLCLKWWWFSY